LQAVAISKHFIINLLITLTLQIPPNIFHAKRPKTGQFGISVPRKPRQVLRAGEFFAAAGSWVGRAKNVTARHSGFTLSDGAQTLSKKGKYLKCASSKVNRQIPTKYSKYAI
jgi:hypothetical protein